MDTVQNETNLVTEDIPSMDEFQEEITNSFRKYEAGDIITGTVIGISETEVTVDLGSYTEGQIKAEELSNDPRFSIKADIHIGDVISATVLREDREGNLLLSKKQAEDVLSWDTLKKYMDEKTICSVKVAEVVKGGVVTYLNGIRAFIPASQLASTYVEDLNSFIGKELSVRVITVDAEDTKLVLSAREVAREAEKEDYQRRINNLTIGTITSGTVEKIMPFGAFVQFGNGLSGLVHISQIAEKRIKSPSEVIKEGDSVNVKILGVKDGKVSLSIKAALESEKPAEELEDLPSEYSAGEAATTGLADLLKGFKL